jgi:hypothetical protein
MSLIVSVNRPSEASRSSIEFVHHREGLAERGDERPNIRCGDVGAECGHPRACGGMLVACGESLSAITPIIARPRATACIDARL